MSERGQARIRSDSRRGAPPWWRRSARPLNLRTMLLHDDAHDDEDRLEAEFPLGDGTADVDASVVCPYCAEPVELTLDPGGGSAQEYVEDCPVCCQPWRVSVH